MAEPRRDKPLIFSAPMVRGLLREVERPGTGKTQTRRGLKPQPTCEAVQSGYDNTDTLRWWPNPIDSIADEEPLKIPYAPGDRLWCRERFRVQQTNRIIDSGGPYRHVCIDYEADGKRAWVKVYERNAPRILLTRKGRSGENAPLAPAIHLPRIASRLTLIVTDVRVQRLQKISERDAKAEGVELTEMIRGNQCWHASHRAAFAGLWQYIHGVGAWDDNPWVASLTFTVHHCNIDSLDNSEASHG